NASEAQAGFQAAAALTPRSPDPHLGLARVQVYYLHNAGAAAAEFHQAERLGFKLGPREMEQEADAYLARARAELAQAERARRRVQGDGGRWVSVAGGDFGRAKHHYEPM